MFSHTYIHTHKNELAVIFDIGNGSVGGSLAVLNSATKPRIIYSHREHLTFVSHIHSERLLDSMLKLFKVVANDILKNGISKTSKKMFEIHPIKHVFCFYSSPWFVSQTKILKVEREKDFIVTRGLLNNIIDREEREFSDELKDGKYEKIFGNNVEILEKKAINITLNGYEVGAVFDQQVRELEITFFTSAISTNIISKVNKIINSSLHPVTISHHSFTLAAWSAIRDAFPDQRDFLFADISGEVTDINITIHGVFMETVSFPLGRSGLIRHVVNDLQVEPEVALSYLSLYKEKKLEPEFTKKLLSIITDFKLQWLTSLTNTLSLLEGRYMIPKTFFITVDSDIGEYFIEELKKSVPLELNIQENQFTVIPLTADILHFVQNSTPGMIKDPFLALETVFTNSHNKQFSLSEF